MFRCYALNLHILTENKGLGIDNLGSVDWLNDNSPTPQAEETQAEQTTEAAEPVADTTEEVVDETTTEVPAEETNDTTESEAVEAGTEDVDHEPAAEAVAEEPTSMFATLGAKLGYEVEGDVA